MTREEATKYLIQPIVSSTDVGQEKQKELEAYNMAIKTLEQELIDKSAMMHEIYMEGVNMAGEYRGCWVRFKDIERIVDKYIKGGD